MSQPSLVYQTSGEKFGFTTSDGNWVIPPDYVDGDQEFSKDRVCLVVQKEDKNGKYIYHLIGPNGEIENLSEVVPGLEEADGLTVTNELIWFRVDDLDGLYSYPLKKIILPPIAQEIEWDDSGYIFIRADGSQLFDFFQDGALEYEHDFAYMDSNGSFILNEGFITEKLNSNFFILEVPGLWGGASDTVLYALNYQGEAQILKTELDAWKLDKEKNVVHLYFGNKEQACFDLNQRAWL